MIHVYKLKTGETIITEFIRMDELSGNTVFVIKNPKVADERCVFDGGDLDDWIQFALNEGEEIPLPKDMIILGYEENKIDSVLLEVYKEEVEVFS